MNVRYWLVAVDPETGDANAEEIESRVAWKAPAVPFNEQHAHENFGPGRLVDAAKAALGAAMPEQV